MKCSESAILGLCQNGSRADKSWTLLCAARDLDVVDLGLQARVMMPNDKHIYKLVAEIIGGSLVYTLTFVGIWWALRRVVGLPVDFAVIILVCTMVGILPAAGYGLWMRWRRPHDPPRALGPPVMRHRVLSLTLFTFAALPATLAGLWLLWLGYHAMGAFVLVTAAVATMYGVIRLSRPVLQEQQLPDSISERVLWTFVICASVGPLATLSLTFLILGNVDAAGLSLIMILPVSMTLVMLAWSVRTDRAGSDS